MKKQEKPDKPMENNCNLTIRVDARLLERADALIDVVSERLGRRALRADVWREALVRGLQELEK